MLEIILSWLINHVIKVINGKKKQVQFLLWLHICTYSNYCVSGYLEPAFLEQAQGFDSQMVILMIN